MLAYNYEILWIDLEPPTGNKMASISFFLL